MARGDFLHPKAPSRAEVLSTVGEQGMNYWRNPVHLRAVHDRWPHPETKEAREDNRAFGMEMEPTYRNGSITS